MIHFVVALLQSVQEWIMAYLFWKVLCAIVLFMSGVCECAWSEKQRTINILVHEQRVRPDVGEYVGLHFYRFFTLFLLAGGLLILFVGV